MWMQPGRYCRNKITHEVVELAVFEEIEEATDIGVSDRLRTRLPTKVTVHW